MNDHHDVGVAEQVDFVGDAADPAGYWGSDENYVCFRMRLDVGSSPVFSDVHFVLIDIDDDVYPDYGFVWGEEVGDALAAEFPPVAIGALLS